MINLREMTSEEMLLECLELEVSKEQEGLVNTPAEALALAWFKRDSVRPFCIYNDDVMVGFALLVFPEPDETDEECEIWQFMIDEKHQGKGFGTAAVKAIVDYIDNKSGSDIIVLGTYPENTRAIKMYEKCGFVLTDEDMGDEVMMLLER